MPSKSATVRTVFIATSGPDVGEASVGQTIANGFATLGARVAFITDQEVTRIDEQISTSFDSRAALEQAFQRAEQRIGVPDLIVHTSIPALALHTKPLENLTQADWNLACHQAVKRMLYCLQAAYTQLAPRGGAVVCIGPSLSLVGAAGLVPLTTAVEAQRALVKSAARQWGRHGITVNWLFLHARTLFPVLQDAAIPAVPELGPPPLALGSPPDTAMDIPELLAFFASDAGRKLTGTSLCADGGEWMVP